MSKHQVKKYRRTRDRFQDLNDPWWSKGYEFWGIAYPEYDQIEEVNEPGSLSMMRIHTLSACEEVKL